MIRQLISSTPIQNIRLFVSLRAVSELVYVDLYKPRVYLHKSEFLARYLTLESFA